MGCIVPASKPERPIRLQGVDSCRSRFSDQLPDSPSKQKQANRVSNEPSTPANLDSTAF
jgi:hypothetical protein